MLLGAPTGSGKTISAELTMLRVFNAHPGKKIIYIAPLKVTHCIIPLSQTFPHIHTIWQSSCSHQFSCCGRLMSCMQRRNISQSACDTHCENFFCGFATDVALSLQEGSYHAQ